MTLVQVQDPRSLVRQILEHELASSPCLKVTVDGPMVVKAGLRQGMEIDGTLACHQLNEVAPLYGFKPIRSDSHGRLQWQRENPRYVICPRHGVRAVLRPYLEGEAVSLRAVHAFHGKHYACRVSSLKIDYLIRCLPRVEILLREYLQRNPCMVGGLEKVDGGE